MVGSVFSFVLMGCLFLLVFTGSTFVEAKEESSEAESDAKVKAGGEAGESAQGGGDVEDGAAKRTTGSAPVQGYCYVISQG